MSDELFDWDAFHQIGNFVVGECSRQHETWGVQNHPDGTGLTGDDELAETVKRFNAEMVRTGNLTWRDILWEEVREAFAESDPDRLIEELEQVAAVAVSWIDAVKRRQAGQ